MLIFVVVVVILLLSVYKCVCLDWCVQKPEVHVQYLSLSFSILFLRQGLSLNPELTPHLAETGWPASSQHLPPCLCPTAWYQAQFLHGWQSKQRSSCSCSRHSTVFPGFLHSYVNKNIIHVNIWKVWIEAQLISPVFGFSWKHSKHFDFLCWWDVANNNTQN